MSKTSAEILEAAMDTYSSIHGNLNLAAICAKRLAHECREGEMTQLVLGDEKFTVQVTLSDAPKEESVYEACLRDFFAWEKSRRKQAPSAGGAA